MLWTAPEVLREEPTASPQKADIYSVGIMLEEIALRGGPYEVASILMSPEGEQAGGGAGQK